MSVCLQNVRKTSVNVRKTFATNDVLKVTNDVLEVTNKKTFNDYLNQPYKNDRKLNEKVEALTEEIHELKEQLSVYDKKPNERIEVFTEEDYVLFQQRLKEWRELNPKIERLEADKVTTDRLFNELNTKNIDQNYLTRDLKRENKDLRKDKKKHLKLIFQLTDSLKSLQATLEKQGTAIENDSKSRFTQNAIEARKTDWKDKE